MRLSVRQLLECETIIYLREILALGKKPRWTPKLALDEFNLLSRGENPRPQEWITKVAQHPKLADIPNELEGKVIARYACKMATGSGKTVVMAMLISWAFCNRGTKPGDPRFPRRALVVCPNLTIKERLSVLRPGDPDSYYEKFDIVPTSLRPELAKGKVLVTNWHWFNPEAEVIKVGGVTVGKLGAETPEAFAKNRLGDLWDAEPLMVLNDEGHHAYRPAPLTGDEKLSAEEKAEREEATVWVSGLDKINAACGIALCVDLSATPFYINGSGYPEGSPFPWIVSDFSLVDAIESGITKIPRLPAIDNTGQPDPKYFKLWEHITRDLKSGERLTGGKPKPEVLYRKAEDALRIDSDLLASAESEDPKATRKEAAEELRKTVSSIGKPGEPGERIRCVVSVNMLSEGWDANNVTHILGLRAFHSQLLCEQVVGRGLRRMDYTPDPNTGLLTPEYVDIFGVPFSLIPFRGREPKKGPPPEGRPKNEVMALPERKQFEIRFPVVEGYAVALQHKRAVLFPQVLRVVSKYVATRVENSVHPCEIGLQSCAQRIVSLLLDAIEPDDVRGEAPLVPRLNRYKPVCSTAAVHFKTVKPVQATVKSHINFVACDTKSWEQAAMFQLERSPEVVCYARNDRLEFNIPYELFGQPHAYEPDFLVRLARGVTLVLEIKGQLQGDTESKHQAAKRWVTAVNNYERESNSGLAELPAEGRCGPCR